MRELTEAELDKATGAGDGPDGRGPDDRGPDDRGPFGPPGPPFQNPGGNRPPGQTPNPQPGR